MREHLAKTIVGESFNAAVGMGDLRHALRRGIAQKRGLFPELIRRAGEIIGIISSVIDRLDGGTRGIRRGERILGLGRRRSAHGSCSWSCFRSSPWTS